MSDAKPTRPARAAGQQKTSPGDKPAATAAPIAAAPPPAPPVVSVPPAAVAEPPPEIAPAGDSALPESAEDPWTAFAEAQAVLARGFEAIATEVTGITRAGLAAAADAAISLLGATTFSEAVEINAGLARRGLDAIIEGSAKLSEIGAKATSDAARPILAQLGANWVGAPLG